MTNIDLALAPEIPASRLATLTEDEAPLAAEISTLWTKHRDAKVTAKRSKSELAAIRRDLAAQLYGMKSLLVRNGRGGSWAAFLRERAIPLATADRYAQRHELELNPDVKLLTEELSETDAIMKLVKSVSPKLAKIVNNPAGFQNFVSALAAGLNFASERDTAEGLRISAP